MIDVTSPAAEKLKSILQEEDAVDSAVRIVVVPAGNGVQYMLTLEKEPKEDDILTEADGVKVLVDVDSAPIMEGVEIDYVEDLMHSGFVITNPNVPMAGGCGSGGCGCGAGGGGGCGSGGCGCGASH